LKLDKSIDELSEMIDKFDSIVFQNGNGNDNNEANDNVHTKDGRSSSFGIVITQLSDNQYKCYMLMSFKGLKISQADDRR
jgi:hypothetical protein